MQKREVHLPYRRRTFLRVALLAGAGWVGGYLVPRRTHAQQSDLRPLQNTQRCATLREETMLNEHDSAGPNMSNGQLMRVFLIHGMGRSTVSMWPLKRYLQGLGFEVSLFGYHVFQNRLDRIAEDFAQFIEAEMQQSNGPTAPGHENGPSPYCVVGHSLGNVITRLAFEHLNHLPSRLIMLAPPNRPPLLARKLRGLSIFRFFTGDAGTSMADPLFYARLPMPSMPAMVIAGNGSPPLPMHPHQDNETDGIVTVHETHLDGAQHHVIPAVHTLIMNHPQARALISGFLRSKQPDECLRT